jgi:hypothetical protein
MALPQIETGYKPEFGLGALYQGFNAANADQMAQEEIVKSFLANQREQQMQPLDVQGKVFSNMQQDLLAQQAQAQNNPGMLKVFADSKQAGYDEAIRKNELGALLQPFAKQQIPLEQGAKTAQLGITKEIADYQRLLANGQDDNGNELTPEQRSIFTRKLTDLNNMLGSTPELAGKTALENIKGQWDYDRTIDAANIQGAKGLQAAHSAAGKELAGLIKSYETQLTKLNTEEIKQEVIMELVREKNRAPTETEITARVNAYKNSLTQRRNMYENLYKQHLTASGITVPESAPAPSTGSTIKYDAQGNRIQ